MGGGNAVRGMQLRERVMLGTLVGAIGGSAAVLLGEALTNKKNNRIKFDSVAATEGVNSDKYLAVRLKELETDFGEHDAEAIRSIIQTFEDMINLYETSVQNPQPFHAWKASTYDQTIQRKLVSLTQKAMQSINKVRARIEGHYDAQHAAAEAAGDGANTTNPEILIKLVNLTRELRGVSTRYREHIQASTVGAAKAMGM